MSASLPGLDPMQRTAELSPCGRYRYLLGRQWTRNPRSTLWVMLNPSIADAYIDDMTVTKCIEFTKRAGFGRITIVNLFAARTTQPSYLTDFSDPVGPDNNPRIADSIRSAALVVFAWGAATPRSLRLHAKTQIEFVQSECRMVNRRPLCLGVTADGSPRHPSRLSYDAELQPWKAA